MERSSKVYWIWLGFDKSDESYLLNIKHIVQKKLKSPKFNIHLTLYGPFEEISNNLVNYLNYLSNNEYSFLINTGNFGLKNLFFESIFISIKKTEKLNKLREKFEEFKNKDLKVLYNPHISLAYGDYKDSEKKKIIADLPQLKKKLKVNKLFVVKVDEKNFLWEKVLTFNLLEN